ncbi:hypothetical protein BHE74_00023639 [Ensete ventricosum]|nr:hypothetical protein BHE74_00023639 [Ensete ventricosum]
MDRLEVPQPRPPPIPLNSTRIEVFLWIQDKGLLRLPNPIKTRPEGRDKRRRFLTTTTAEIGNPCHAQKEPLKSKSTSLSMALHLEATVPQHAKPTHKLQ